MGAYEALAASYDRLTNDVDYRATVDFYREILAQEGLHPRTAVDLACGTGSVSVEMALSAYKGRVYQIEPDVSAAWERSASCWRSRACG